MHGISLNLKKILQGQHSFENDIKLKLEIQLFSEEGWQIEASSLHFDVARLSCLESAENPELSWGMCQDLHVLLRDTGDLQYRSPKVNFTLSAEKHGSIPVMELIPLQSLL